MRKSESATQEWNLASVSRGALVEILEVGPDHADELLVHGLRPGVRLTVEGDAPFGGPRIVRLGGSRVAIDRHLARTMPVRGVAAEDRGRSRAGHRGDEPPVNAPES